MTVPPIKPGGLAKPTLDTKYYIDYEWWRTSTEDLRKNLLRQMPPEYKEAVLAEPEDRELDYIDPKTGRVSRVNPLQFALKAAAENPEYLSEDVSLADVIFRVLLIRENAPISSRELAELTGREVDKIFGLLKSTRVLYGLRPDFG